MTPRHRHVAELCSPLPLGFLPERGSIPAAGRQPAGVIGLSPTAPAWRTDIGRPDMVGLRDPQVAQEIGLDSKGRKPASNGGSPLAAGDRAASGRGETDGPDAARRSAASAPAPSLIPAWAGRRQWTEPASADNIAAHRVGGCDQSWLCACQQLLLPFGDLRGVDLKMLRQFGPRLVAVDRRQRHLHLKRRSVIPSPSLHRLAPLLRHYLGGIGEARLPLTTLSKLPEPPLFDWASRCNAFIESFNGRSRDECLNADHFPSLAEAESVIEAQCAHYNQRLTSRLVTWPRSRSSDNVRSNRPLKTSSALVRDRLRRGQTSAHNLSFYLRILPSFSNSLLIPL